MPVDVGSTDLALARPRSRRARLGVLVACGILLVVTGHAAGSHRSRTREVTGPAYVGDHVITMTVHGTSYGFRDSVPWIDAANSYHEGGWPACLPALTEMPAVTFGITKVDYPNGSSGDQVVYVDCRS